MVAVTANEIRIYQRALEVAAENKLKVDLVGDSFSVSKDVKLLGVFRTLEALYNFLLGYDWAKHSC